MRIRPLNDTIFVEPDPIEKHKGLIEICENNSLEKISSWATIVSWGSKCLYRYQVGQRVLIDRFFDTPSYIEVEGKKIRIIREHYLHAVDEE